MYLHINYHPYIFFIYFYSSLDRLQSHPQVTLMNAPVNTINHIKH